MPRQLPKAKPDVSQTAEAMVRAVTGTQPQDGSELLGSPELQRLYREAKAKDRAGRKRQ